LHISEEYGYNSWYAVLSDERFEELKNNWKTIKGLNCLVPVRFLVPEAVNFPLLKKDEYLSDRSYLEKNKIRIENAHIHQSDDSYLADVEYEIPEQDNFEFMGVKYSENELNEIFNKYRSEDNKEYERRYEESPEKFQCGIVPEAWQRSGFGPLDEIFDWPEDAPLPTGWTRANDGRIVRQY
jgi:hypothetical protein